MEFLNKVWGVLKEFVSSVKTLNSLIGFAVVLVSVFAILALLSRKYRQPFRQLLKGQGLPFGVKVKVLFRSRGGKVYLIRVFLETALLRTEGRRLSRAEWKQFYRDFLILLASSQDKHYTISVRNCTLLTRIDNSCGEGCLLQNYFDYFSRPKVRKTFGIPENEPIGFFSYVKIEEGFLTDTMLLTGLMSTYGENWDKIIKKYISSARQDSRAVTLSEMYLAYAWMLWGPSYQLREQDNSLRLGQLLFGDENNSIYVVMDRDGVGNRVWDSLHEGGNRGLMCAVEGRLFDNRQFVESHINEINPKNAYFFQRICKNAGTSNLLFYLTAEEPIKKMCRDEQYFGTGYLWIMFDTAERADAPFLPQNAIVFFEHANFANAETCRMFTDFLFEKIFTFFKRVFSRPGETKRKYRYCLSMSAPLEKAFLEKFRRRADAQSTFAGLLRENVLIPAQNTVSDTAVFSALDHYFSNAADNVEAVNIDLSREGDLELLGNFYISLMYPNFPDDDERESLENLISYCKRAQEGKTKDRYHILLLKQENKILAGAVFDYLYASNCGVVEFVVSSEKHRRSGLGRRLFSEVTDCLRRDAVECGRKDLDWIVCEIDNPETRGEDLAYLHFWRSGGFRRLDAPYYQPPLERGKRRVEKLWLVALPCSAQTVASGEFPVKTYETFLRGFFSFCFSVREPEKSAEYRDALSACAGRENIPLLPL